MRKSGKRYRVNRGDPLLITQPWKVASVFAPIEQVIDRIARDGTVDAAGGVPVFHEDARGGWYEIVPALAGVLEFHQLAAARYGLGADVAGLERLGKKLDVGAPIFDTDLSDARRAIVSCKQQAMRLRVSQAQDIVTTVQTSMALERAGAIKAEGDHAAHA